MEYSLKYAVTSHFKMVLYLLFEREPYSAFHETVKRVCSTHGRIYVKDRLTCSLFFVHCSCQNLCSPVPLLFSPISMSVAFQMQEMFCRHARSTWMGSKNKEQGNCEGRENRPKINSVGKKIK